MMEKELVGLFEDAKKAAAAAAVDGASANGPEVARCIDALKQLKSFPVNKDALVSTQVGRHVRHLTKHPQEKIQTMATDLLEVWKKVVIDETLRIKKSASFDGKSSTVKTEVSKASSAKVEKVVIDETMRVKKSASFDSKSSTVKTEVSKASSAKVEKVSNNETVKVENTSTESVKVERKGVDTVKAEKRARDETVKVEKIPKEEKQSSSTKKPSLAPTTPKLTSMVECNDAVRDKLREIIAEALSKVANEADASLMDEVKACDPIRIAVSVESVMYEKLGRSTGSQKFKYRSIMFNLKDQNNPDLRRRVLLGHISPETLITLTPEEMASDERQAENNKIKKKALFDCERGGAPKATTDQFKCGRCGQRKTTYHQMQTRSADEPMTTYVTCVNCNNHWKFC